MSSLQVRELPENIYHQLKSRAEADHRSLAQEAVAILAKGLKTSSSPKQRRAALLQQIASVTKLDSKAITKLDPVVLIREDRER
ncbi:MAG: Arc family DNA-binding protein [Thiotrichales bacterium]|nr:Arc family DNA-binding protein [Thiotrichales bacterium]